MEDNIQDGYRKLISVNDKIRVGSKSKLYSVIGVGDTSVTLRCPQWKECTRNKTCSFYVDINDITYLSSYNMYHVDQSNLKTNEE